MTSPQPNHDLRVHQLTSSATNAQISQILNLSKKVFGCDPATPTNHSSPSYWRQRLSQPKSVIFFVTRADDTTPLGFFFDYIKNDGEIEGESMHIWLAATDKEARGLGIFPLLVKKTREHAREMGIEWVSVRTVPSRFTKMFRILGANGWEIVSWKGGEGPEVKGAQVLMKQRVGETLA